MAVQLGGEQSILVTCAIPVAVGVVKGEQMQ